MKTSFLVLFSVFFLIGCSGKKAPEKQVNHSEIVKSTDELNNVQTQTEVTSEEELDIRNIVTGEENKLDGEKEDSGDKNSTNETEEQLIEEAQAESDEELAQTEQEQVLEEEQDEVALDEAVDLEVRPNYGEIFCEMIKSEEIKNPFELEKHFSEVNRRAYEPRVVALLSAIPCQSSELIFDKNPMQLFSIKVSEEPVRKVFFSLNLDSDNKILDISSYYEEGLEIKHYDVEMRDGKKLTTFFIGKEDAEVTALWRTPYINSRPAGIFGLLKRFFNDSSFNMVIQANRGSFHSDGSFKWLHKENINDGYDTIEWITKQSFNKGKVMPFGISYPGFNALAAGASSHPAILANISCSSPTNAVTDSLTNSRSATPTYLDYIIERESNDPASNLLSKINYLIDQNDFRMDTLDQELFGRSLDDWQDFVSSYQNKDSLYWDERNILNDLGNIHKPTVHIAGLKNDQDSRDTILTYQHIKENNINPHLHQLYLHKDGHGCGDFMQTNHFREFLSGFGNADQPVKHFSYTESTMKSFDSYDHAFNEWEEVVAEREHMRLGRDLLNNTTEKVKLYDSIVEGDKHLQVFVPVKNSGILNGSIKVEFEVENYLYESHMEIAAYVIDAQGNYVFSSITSYGEHFKASDFGQRKKIEVLLEPMGSYAVPGGWILVKVYTSNPYIVAFNKNERLAFYNENLSDGRGYLGVDLTRPFKVFLPRETAEPITTEAAVDGVEELLGLESN